MNKNKEMIRKISNNIYLLYLSTIIKSISIYFNILFEKLQIIMIIDRLLHEYFGYNGLIYLWNIFGSKDKYEEYKK